jgi:hypothetical protein
LPRSRWPRATRCAYEFWLRTQTIGQAYQLRDYRLIGADVFLGRRRITSTLALRIFDIGDLAAARRVAHLPERGLRISWQSYLRIDHDFGDYTMGRITVPGPIRRDVIDVIPELGGSAAALDVMYGYLELAGLADDHLSLQLGRMLVDDGWGATGVDGVAARYELPAPLAVSASAGLRVRAASPFGVSSYELDGTSGADCRQYIAGPTPGTGSWQLIDRNRLPSNLRLTSDAYCPQRDVRQPTVALAIATSRIDQVSAELGYRRTWSDTVGLIGPLNDRSYLYPNEFGQAPATGVDEERLYARLHAHFRPGAVHVEPYADARFSLLHATFDRADAGVRIRQGAHQLQPEVSYFFPTFDGDSIFNVFSIEPTSDARLAYQYWPSGPWRGTADAWLRRYSHEDGASSYAGGGSAGIERRIASGWRGRLDGLADGGWGGRRVGGSAEANWRDGNVWLRGRLVVLDAREDGSLARRYRTSSTVASTTWRVADSVALHAIAEADDDAIHHLQLRAIGVLDLAFAPEP